VLPRLRESKGICASRCFDPRKIWRPRQRRKLINALSVRKGFLRKDHPRNIPLGPKGALVSGKGLVLFTTTKESRGGALSYLRAPPEEIDSGGKEEAGGEERPTRHPSRFCRRWETEGRVDRGPPADLFAPVPPKTLELRAEEDQPARSIARPPQRPELPRRSRLLRRNPPARKGQPICGAPLRRMASHPFFGDKAVTGSPDCYDPRAMDPREKENPSTWQGTR